MPKIKVLFRLIAAAVVSTAMLLPSTSSARADGSEVIGRASLTQPCSGSIADQGAYGGGWWILYYNSSNGGTNCLIFKNTSGGGLHHMRAEVEGPWPNYVNLANDEGYYHSYAGPSTVYGVAHVCVRVALFYDDYPDFSKITGCH